MEENKKTIMVEKHKWPDEIRKEKISKYKKIAVVIACIACFGVGFLVNGLITPTQQGTPITSSSSNKNKEDSSKFMDVYEILKNDWYFGKDIKNIDDYLMDQAIRGLADDNEMDQHTQYLDKTAAQALMTSLSGSLTGIGIQYYEINGSILVDKVFIDSPAEKAKMKEGDIIKKVDGVDISKKKIDEIKEMIIGDEGTKVTIEVQRGNETVELAMVREKISVTVYGYIVDNDTGVLELSSFSDNTADEVEKYLKAFEKKDVKNIVIDLRDNGGGYVNTAIDIAGLFLGKGKTVLYQENKAGEILEYTTKSIDDVYEFDNMAILTNENTASASELLTAAFQYHLDAQVVGTKSYGKGTVQNSVNFDDDSIFKFTIAEWLTPAKEKIHKVGIEPDYEVKLDDALTYAPAKDEATYKVDQVGLGVRDMQMYLKFLGYDVDRKDGYYSQATLTAVKKFQEDNGHTVNGEITPDLISSATSATARKWHDEKSKLDTQMIKALEVVRGK